MTKWVVLYLDALCRVKGHMWVVEFAMLLLLKRNLCLNFNGLCSPKFKYKTRSHPLVTCVGRHTRNLRKTKKLSVLAVGRDNQQ